MTLSVTLPEPTVEVVAGRSASVEVRVADDGSEEQRVRLVLAGRAAGWLQLAGADGTAPPALTVAAGGTATVTLVVSPPRGAAVPGQLVPFSVQATTPDVRRPAAVATGLVLFAAPVPVTAVLVPATARAARSSQHVVELGTDDAAGVLVTLHVATPQPGTTVTVEPVAVRAQPGLSARADVVVRTGRPAVWAAREHPFEVVWETHGADGLARGSVTGRLQQSPLLPAPVTVGLVLALLAVLGVGVWALRPPGERPSDRTGVARADVDRATSAPSTPAPVRGPVAVVHTQLKGTDAQASRQLAEQRAAGVQLPAGTEVAVVDGGALGLNPAFWLVVVRGFPDDAAAQEFCAGHPTGTCNVPR